MTKMKSKKMTKSTFAIIIMAIIMVAMLAFGGTYAYFTATANTKQADVTVGRVSLTSDGTFTGNYENIVPGRTLLSQNISYVNKSTVDSFIAVKFTAYYTGYIFDVDGVTTAADAYHAYLSTADDTEEALKVELVRKNRNGEELNADGKTKAELDVAAQASFAAQKGYLLHVTNLPIEGDNMNVFSLVDKTDGSVDGNLASAIDSNVWVKGTGDYSNIYLMKKDSKFAVAPEVLDSVNTEYDEVAFLNLEGVDGTADDKAVIFNINRHFHEGEWDIDWTPATGTKDGTLQWEDASVTFSIEAYSIQAEGVTYDTNGPEADGVVTLTDLAVEAASVGTIWEAMQEQM